MDTRFNSFYHEDMHPFVDAMVGLLQESGARARRPAVATYFMRSAQQKYDSDIALLKQVVKEVVAERKANLSDKTLPVNFRLLAPGLPSLFFCFVNSLGQDPGGQKFQSG